MGDYTGLLILTILAAVIAGAMVTLSWLLGPKSPTRYKASPYECGVAPVGDARERFPIKFYLVAMLFILFDIEVVFLWSWMTVFREAETAFKVFSFAEVLIYMATWIAGYLYAVRVNAMDWDETTSLASADEEQPALEGAA
ncbi:MAG TPA: NADH-quinone oxidoreductase subunit A [Armatimonadetes bacterium]|jgi:NADH-quinone oxidoreductase subunit A|nr:NADH-quinone oxidoreductase subunit A [Armatimonadota bacterium]MCA1996598.1 NADH-quinone oxidoreductase subunit A [Armatimonadota bacterium]HCE01015.1 NADH-quinone oxidoreductase subunit A [Armatimonadota bacterium]